MKRAWCLLAVLFASCIALTTPGSAQPNSPAWPNLSLASCPTIVPSIDPSRRTWKHGQPEQGDFAAAAMAKDQKEGVRLLEEFVEKYPDSDYLDVVLLGAWMAYGATLNDTQGQLRVAEKIVESPVAAMTRVAGFVTLCSMLSPYVNSDDPQMEKKLADLDMWVRCGREALAVEVRPPNLPQENFDKFRTFSEFALERTAGYVALLRLDYGLADSKLQAASKLNPQDTLTYLWLSHAKLLASSPDLDSGVFYLARATELSGSLTRAAFGSVPQKQMDDYLKRVYMLVHGSDKGLENLKTLAKSNTSPPLGFSVVRQPKEKHHYGTTITAVAVVALLASAAIKYPWIGQQPTRRSRSTLLQLAGFGRLPMRLRPGITASDPSACNIRTKCDGPVQSCLSNSASGSVLMVTEN